MGLVVGLVSSVVGLVGSVVGLFGIGGFMGISISSDWTSRGHRKAYSCDLGLQSAGTSVGIR